MTGQAGDGLRGPIVPHTMSFLRSLLFRAGGVVAAVSLMLPVSVAAAKAGTDTVFPRMDYAALQWHVAAVNAPQAWNVSTGEGVTVAVIDTGLDVTAEAFAGRIVSPARVGKDFSVVAAPTLTDSEGHGTHVAGIIGAAGGEFSAVGVAPAVKIMPIDVSGTVANRDTGPAAIAAALDYAVAHGAGVVNLSLGFDVIDLAHSSEARVVCRAVADAVAANVVVVVAAGNNGEGHNVLSVPAGCPGALSVAAVDTEFRPTYWSSSDATVDVAAPGEGIVSLSPAGSVLPVRVESGTSMAAPVVSGVVALVRSRYPSWSAGEVVAAVERSAWDVYAPGRDSVTGAGVVDAAKAVGVVTGPPQRQLALSVTFDGETDFSALGYPECGVCAYVAWRTLPVPVVAYQVDVVRDGNVVVSRQFGPEQVRAMLTDVMAGDWVMVSAVLPDGGTVRSVPGQVRAGGSSDDEFSGSVNVRWVSQHTVRVTWGTGSAGWEAVEAVIAPYGVDYDEGRDTVEFNLESSSGSRLVRVPSSLTGFSLTVYVKWVTPDNSIVEMFAPVLAPAFPVQMDVVSAGDGMMGIVGHVVQIESRGSLVGAPVRVVMADGTSYSTVVLGNGLFSVTVPEVRSGKYRFTVRIGSGKQQMKHGFVLSPSRY